MSTDLETRLRSLGEHLDAERGAAVDATEVATVVPFAPRRTPRIWWAAAAAAVLIVGLVAVFASRDDATQPTDSVPPTPSPTAPPTTIGSADTTAAEAGRPPSSEAGDLPLDVTYRRDDLYNGGNYTRKVVERIGERSAAIGVDVEVSDENPSDTALRLVLRGVRSEDAVAAQRAFLSIGDDVVVRPVTGGCGTVAELPLVTPERDPTAEQRLPWPTGAPGTWCVVGPAALNHEVFSESSYVASVDPAVPGMLTADLAPGGGEEAWNTLAAACYDRDSTCPTGQIAIEWGGVLMNVATVQAPEFSGTVALGAFGEIDGEALADQLNRGPAPFTLTLVTP